MTGQEVAETVSNGSALPRLESVERLSKLPLVESALGVASGIYGKVKESSSVVNWTFTHAEGVGVAILAPVASRLEAPIHAVDTIFAKGMDIVEDAVPAIKLTPKQVLDNTRDMLAAGLGLKLPGSDASVTARVVGASLGAAVLGLRATVTVLEDYMDEYYPVTKKVESETHAETSSDKPEEDQKNGDCESCKNEPSHVIHRWKVVLTRIQGVLAVFIERRRGEAAKFLGSVLEFIMDKFNSRQLQLISDFLAKSSRILQEKTKSTMERVNEIIQNFVELTITIATDATHFVSNLPKEVATWYKYCQCCGMQMLQAALQLALRNMPRLEAVNGCDSDERAKLLIARQGNGMAPPPKALEAVPASSLAEKDKSTTTDKSSATQEMTSTEDKASSDPKSSTSSTVKGKAA